MTIELEDSDPYRDEHRPDAQNHVDGVPVDPVLRPGFASTPHDERDQLEVDDWWDRPYIERVPNSAWTHGKRYDVRVLDGGAWDRPTAKGAFATLDEALELAWDLQRADDEPRPG